MTDEVRLQDPISGITVRIGRADLMQACPRCGRQMLGRWIGATEDTGWACLEHLQNTLMVHNMSDKGAAAAAAREQLQDLLPGDQTTVTRQLLVAVGL